MEVLMIFLVLSRLDANIPLRDHFSTRPLARLDWPTRSAESIQQFFSFQRDGDYYRKADWLLPAALTGDNKVSFHEAFHQ